MTMKKYKFEATIKISKVGKGGAYVEFPYSVEKEFGVKGRVGVIAFFDGIEYQGSLVKMGTGCHIIGITKNIREQIHKKIGDIVEIILYKDENQRIIELNPILQECFKENPTAYANYKKLSFTNRKEINAQLNSAKKSETLQKRFRKIIELLN